MHRGKPEYRCVVCKRYYTKTHFSNRRLENSEFNIKTTKETHAISFSKEANNRICKHCIIKYILINRLDVNKDYRKYVIKDNSHMPQNIQNEAGEVQCFHCLKWLPKDMYYKSLLYTNIIDSAGKDRLINGKVRVRTFSMYTKCKQCHTKSTKEYYKRNKDKVNAYNKQRYEKKKMESQNLREQLIISTWIHHKYLCSGCGKQINYKEWQWTLRHDNTLWHNMCNARDKKNKKEK